MSPDREAGAERPASEALASDTDRKAVAESRAECAPDPARRRFLHRASLGLGLAVAGALGIPWLTFLLSPARLPSRWSDIPPACAMDTWRCRR